MTARQLALRTGIGEGRISDYLSGRHTPGSAQLLRMLAATGHGLRVVPNPDANGRVNERFAVSDADWTVLARHAAALREIETDDEGTAEWRARRIEEADADRTRHRIPPLKTEPELHRRARDLGLLRR